VVVARGEPLAPVSYARDSIISSPQRLVVVSNPDGVRDTIPHLVVWERLRERWCASVKLLGPAAVVVVVRGTFPALQNLHILPGYSFQRKNKNACSSSHKMSLQSL
jgi:hypothetical protein